MMIAILTATIVLALAPLQAHAETSPSPDLARATIESVESLLIAGEVQMSRHAPRR